MKTLLLGAALLGCLGAPISAQTTVTLSPDRDATLYDAFGADLANGAGTRIFSGVVSTGQFRRSLLSFDLSSIPPGSLITSVDFEVTEVMNANGGSATYSLHEVSRDWGEGSAVASGGQGGGQAPGMGDATWNAAMFGSVLWTNPGGDFDPTASSSAVFALGGGGTRTIPSSANLVADVQGWLDNPGTNLGWVFKSDESTSGAVAAYGSRESGTPPQLSVTYTAAPAMVTIAPSRDNTLYDTFGETTNGGGTRVFAGVTVGNQLRRAILGFDVAGSIPAGATITDVSFEISEEMNAFGGSALFSLHEVTQDWGEGTSVAMGGQGAGGSIAPGDVSWVSRMFGSTLWTNPGGDFDPTASASAVFSLGGGGTRTIPSSAGLVADVQNWLDNPSTNFGWILKTDEMMQGAVSAYGSRESINPPQLTISYIPGAGPNAANVPFGMGCTGTGATPLTISGIGLPQLGNASYGLQISGGAPFAILQAVSLGLGGFPPGLPLPTGGGCFFYLDPAGLAGTLVPNPMGTVLLPIPAPMAFAGVSVFVQAIQIEPSLAILGSNGLEIQVGF